MARFKSQLQALGLSFDWDREINTTDPEYYKWTQWIFIQLFKKGLAYKEGDHRQLVHRLQRSFWPTKRWSTASCERCGSPVVQKNKSQWMLKITAYADRLINDLDVSITSTASRPSSATGSAAATGAEVGIRHHRGGHLKVFTPPGPTPCSARPTWSSSPEHAFIKKWADAGLIKNADAVAAYQEEAARKSDFERTELNKEKTGVELEGVGGINPVNGKEIPIFISDYVLMSYGTGAIMAVPAHDTRDWEFAKSSACPSWSWSRAASTRRPFTDVATGTWSTPDFLNGLSVEDAKNKMYAWLEENGKGHKQVNFKLRDWVFSRQRYWGRAYPHGLLRQVRLGAPARERAAPAPARDQGL